MTVRVSVVVPTWRRPQLLERCVTALVAQNFPATEYEIIIADDADERETKRQVVDWMRRVGRRTPILYAPVWDAHGPAAARNVGWRLAAAEVIAFTDDDAIPRRDWLMRGLAAMSGDVVAVAGRVDVPVPHAQLSGYELDTTQFAGGEFVSANCFVRRAALAGAGGFDERFTADWREDSDLLFSLLEARGKVVAAPGAVVIQPMRPARWGVSLRQQRKILFDVLLYKKHAALYRSRIRRSARWDYYAIVLLLILALLGFTAGWTSVGIIASAAWLVATGMFGWRRLRATTRTPTHVVEMIAASALIPPLAVFWRLVGALRFRTFLA